MRKLYTNFRWGLTGEPQQMLVENGRVVARGPSVNQAADKTVDLLGRYLLPGFIDAHCHILPTGLDLEKLHLGPCSNREDVLDAVGDWLRFLPEGKWLRAVHYDHTKFPGGDHLTRADLDKISDQIPILLRHSSGHASVANSAALRSAGVTEETPDPTGGSFRRDSAGRMDGVLLETAHEHVSRAAPDPTQEEMVQAIMRAGERMRSLGITCASDMMTGLYDLRMELEAYRIAAEKGCQIRTRLYMQWATVFGPRGIAPAELSALIGTLNPELTKVAGVKIFADGAIGSATAAIYGKFSGQPANGPVISRRKQPTSESAPEGVETDGQLIYSPERLNQMVRTAHDAGYGIAIHSIGDYSTDLVMSAYEALGDARHHRIEHAMLMSDAQIERMAKLGCLCTMQPEFLKMFSHAYMRQLGPERASKLIRARSVIDAGIPLSFNSDRPIVPGDPWDGILTATHRPEGFDPSEAVTREEAILAYTAEAARSNRDEDMGQLLPSQLADFQLYTEDPMTSPRPEPVTP